MRILSLALFLVPSAMAQTAQVPATPVDNPGCKDPGWTLKFPSPAPGKTVVITLPPRVLPPAGPTTTQPAIATVTMKGAEYTAVINIPASSEFVTNPDGTTTILGVTISLTPVAK